MDERRLRQIWKRGVLEPAGPSETIRQAHRRRFADRSSDENAHRRGFQCGSEARSPRARGDETGDRARCREPHRDRDGRRGPEHDGGGRNAGRDGENGSEPQRQFHGRKANTAMIERETPVKYQRMHTMSEVCRVACRVGPFRSGAFLMRENDVFSTRRVGYAGFFPPL